MRAIALLIVFLILASSAQAVCPPAPVSSGHDTVIQLKASGGVAGIGPAANLVSNTQGTLIFDTSANIVKFCDGNNWVSLGGGGGGGDSIPTGAVMAFDLASCPTGWTEYTASRGRFLRGIDNGAGIDPDGTRTPGDLQDDAMQQITGSIQAGFSYRLQWIANMGAFGISAGPTAAGAQPSGAGNSTTLTFDSANSPDARTSTETRPKNVAVLFCRKS